MEAAFWGAIYSELTDLAYYDLAILLSPAVRLFSHVRVFVWLTISVVYSTNLYPELWVRSRTCFTVNG